MQRNAYCYARVMLAWIDNFWMPQIAGPSVLLLDSLRVHRVESVRNSLECDCHTRVEFVSPGTTGFSKPTDVLVMRPFKHRCHMLYLALNREHGCAVAP